MTGAGILGCPIVGAEVCIEEHLTRNKFETRPHLCQKTQLLSVITL